MNEVDIHRPDFKLTGLERLADSLGSCTWRIIDNEDIYVVSPRKTFVWWMWLMMTCPMFTGLLFIGVLRQSLFPELLIGFVVLFLLALLQLWVTKEFKKGAWIYLDKHKRTIELPRLGVMFPNNSVHFIRLYSWPGSELFMTIIYFHLSESEYFPMLFSNNETSTIRNIGCRVAELLAIRFEKIEKDSKF